LLSSGQALIGDISKEVRALHHPALAGGRVAPSTLAAVLSLLVDLLLHEIVEDLLIERYVLVLLLTV
jgi:hypothetical protein